MAEILKISEAASLALHTMVYLAEVPGEKATTNQIATAFKVSEAHLSKVLQRLTKVGLVKSIRGPKGGFVIGKKPEEVTLLDVFESIEGPLSLDDCLLGMAVCSGECILGDLLHSVNSQLKERLGSTRLDQLKGMFACLVGPCEEPKEDSTN